MSETVTPTPAAQTDMSAKMAALTQVFTDKFANGFDDPVVFVTRTFWTPAVKQFYKRDFPLISRTLFLESVYRRRPNYNQEVLDGFTAMVGKKIGDVLTYLGTSNGRLQGIIETHRKSHGSFEEADYMRPRETLIPVISSHANSYLVILQQLDVLYRATGSAMLNGAIDGNQRKNFELQARQVVRAITSMIRNESIKLHKESQRMRAAASAAAAGAAPANGVDPELETAEQVHGSAIAEFDQETSQAIAAGDDTVVTPENAGQVISDLTATAKANTARGAKRAKANSDAAPAAGAATAPAGTA